MKTDPIVVVGAGHAGVQIAASLREEGYDGAIALVSAETHLPYQRPPLSKAFLKGAMDAEGLPLRAAQFYSENNIDLVFSESVTDIDRISRRVLLASGRAIDFSQLVLATGARQRPLVIPGIDLDGVLVLRDLDDARLLRQRLAIARRIVVIGAGFIGLEIASTASIFGLEVSIVELAARPLGRAVSEAVSQFYLDAHQTFGARFYLEAGVRAIHGRSGRAVEVELSDGRRLPADVVVVGVGVLPEDRLAAAAGLECANGIVVSAHLETADPGISAIGDCAMFPSHNLGFPVRLESVQNAVDQARCLARRIVGKPQPYTALPWFWSDQGDLKLQIAGLSHGCDRWTVRGDPAARAFSAFGFRGPTLVAVESVNRPADHMIARRIIAGALPLTPAQAGDLAFDLRKLAKTSER